MKLKFIALAVCSLLCVGSAYAAVNTVANDTKYVIADESGVDISAGVTISGWQSSAELKLLTISFDKNVLADFDYDAMDTETYAYILEYLCFNGKTVKEINEDTSLGALSWEYTQFPGNADDKYKVPVLVFERDAARLRLFIHENYFNALGGSVTFEMKKGLTFINEGATYTMNKTRKFVYDGSAWVAEKEEKDITANVSINGWTTAGTANELTYTCINFGEGVLPSDLGYHILDTDIGTQYHYIKDFITVNGKTVGEINEETDVSSYIFSSFPSTAADKYKLPIILFGNGGNLEVKIHNDYIATLGDNIEISVKAGLYFDGESNRYTIKNDITAMVKGTKEMDVTEGVAINGWDATGDASELTYTRINLGEGVMPAIGYGIIDVDAWKYIQEYITINGRTIAEINANTDDSAYVYSTFPSTADVKYQIPVMIYVNDGTLEVKVHNDYIATLGEDPEIAIGVKAGLTIAGENILYKVAEDVAVTVKEPAVIVDVTANVVIGGWKMIGDLSELTRTTISFGEGVMPEDVDYGIMDTAKYGYMLDYFTINGKTVREINETTDVSSYVFHTFPSTASAKYQVPVVIYVNGDNVELKIHNDYLAALGGNIDVIVGVKAGLSIVNGSTTYTVSSDVTEYARRKAYTLTIEMNPGEDEQFLTVGSEIVLTAPTKEHYTFIGWFEKGTDNAVLSVMPERDYTVYAKYEAIAYTVTFMDGDTVVDTVTYTLDNTAITEPAVPTKEGFTSAWAIYELTGGNMTVKVVYTEIIEDDSSSDSSSDTSSDSSDDIIDDSSSSDDIVDDNTGSASSDDVVSGTTSDDDNSSSSGCFGTVSGAYVAVVGMLAVALLKKKENE